VLILAALVVSSVERTVVGAPRAAVGGGQTQRDLAAVMTQAKLQAELGNHRSAAEAFASIAKDATAPATLRGEALVRLGLASSAAGDVRASMDAFTEALALAGSDPKTMRFLTSAVARTVPGRIWPDFRAQFEDLLRHAEVVSFEELAMGDIRPKRVTLRKGEIELRAAWKPFASAKSAGGGTHTASVTFREPAEIAAYEMDKMLGLDMVPPTVERTIQGVRGSMTLWINGCKVYKELEGKMPATSDWSRQSSRMQLFDALIGNTGRHATNLLVDPKGGIVLIDHVLAFPGEADLGNPPVRFDRRVVAKLRTLRDEDLRSRLKDLLDPGQIQGLLERRAALLAHVARLVAEKGEAAVLF
jgi:hypothetical protein